MSDLDNCDRDPRRIRRDGNGGNCYSDCSHFDAAIVERPCRPPLNRFNKPSLAVDKTVQVQNGDNFIRRDGDNLGSARPEAPKSHSLRFRDLGPYLNKSGSRFRGQFRRFGYNRREHERSMDVSTKARSLSNPFHPDFTPKPTNQWFGSQKVTPSKNLRSTLRRHHPNWDQIHDQLSTANSIDLYDPYHRDEKYFDEFDKLLVHQKIDEPKMTVKSEKRCRRGEIQEFTDRPVYGNLVYERYVQSKSKKKKGFSVRVNHRASNPRVNMKIAGISRGIRPQIEVTGWRRKVKVG